MRRKERERSEAFGWEVFDRAVYATLSVLAPDGSPYGVPVSPVRIGTTVYFHCAKKGLKLDAIARDPRVSLACVGRTRLPEDEFTVEYESCILTGRAALVEDEAERIAALRALCEKYTPANMANFEREIERSLPATALVRIRVEAVTAKEKPFSAPAHETGIGLTSAPNARTMKEVPAPTVGERSLDD